MFRLLSVQLKKLFTSPIFYTSIIAFITLLMFSPLHMNYENNTEESVIYCLWHYSKQDMINIGISEFFGYAVFKRAVRGWVIIMFVPVLASLASVNIFSDEREFRVKRETVLRTGKKQYLFSNILFFMISGGLICMIGYIVFGILCGALFPALSDFSAQEINDYFMFNLKDSTIIKTFYSHLGVIGLYLCDSLFYFLYGALLSLPSILISSFLKNKYLIVCIPFFLKYCMNNISQRFYLKAGTQGNMNYHKWAEILNPESLINILSGNDYIKQIIIVNMLLAVILSACFVLIQSLGVDKGE